MVRTTATPTVTNSGRAILGKSVLAYAPEAEVRAWLNPAGKISGNPHAIKLCMTRYYRELDPRRARIAARHLGLDRSSLRALQFDVVAAINSNLRNALSNIDGPRANPISRRHHLQEAQRIAAEHGLKLYPPVVSRTEKGIARMAAQTADQSSLSGLSSSPTSKSEKPSMWQKIIKWVQNLFN